MFSINILKSYKKKKKKHKQCMKKKKAAVLLYMKKLIHCCKFWEIYTEIPYPLLLY